MREPMPEQYAQQFERAAASLALDRADLTAQVEQTRTPVAWRYWKDKFCCWEYSDVPLEFPAVPAGTKMEPLYLGPNALVNCPPRRVSST